MLLHYFLTHLPPLEISSSPPISTIEFIRRARDCLSDHVCEDLERLFMMTLINRNFFSDASPFHDDVVHDYAHKVDVILPSSPNKFAEVTRSLYWTWLEEECHYTFIRRFAKDAALLFRWLAHMLAPDENTASSSMRHDSYDALHLAFHDPNPLTLEYALGEALSRSASTHARSDDAFCIDHVFAYFINLMISERLSSFDKAQGQTIFDRIVTSNSSGALYERA